MHADLSVKPRARTNPARTPVSYGRFMQADPIGYDGGMNLYGYVGNDPVNHADPSGLAEDICTGTRLRDCNDNGGLCQTCSGFGGLGYPDYGEKLTGTLDLYKITEKTTSNGVLSSWTQWRGTGIFGGFSWDGSYVAQGIGGACRPQPLCLGREGPETAATMRGLRADEDFVAGVAVAWLLSQGHYGRYEIHEHGFWARQNGGGYDIGHWREAGDNPRAINHLGPTPRGFDIFFHTHPFRDSHGGFSEADIGFAISRRILLLSYTAGRYYALDMRGN